MDGEGRLIISTVDETLAANAVGDIQAGDYLRISVIDTGCGMTAEVKERAFGALPRPRKWARAPASASARYSASRTSRAVRSGSRAKSGRGTTVSIYLPRTGAAATNVASTLGSARKPKSPSPARACCWSRRSAGAHRHRRRARGPGYEPVSCSSGAEALELFEVEQFDLVISDVIMPEMSGPDLIRELRARGPTSRRCSSPAMLARARSRTSSAMTSCASRSPSTRSPARSLGRVARSAEPRPIGGAAAAG